MERSNKQLNSYLDIVNTIKNNRNKMIDLTRIEGSSRKEGEESVFGSRQLMDPQLK